MHQYIMQVNSNLMEFFGSLPVILSRITELCVFKAILRKFLYHIQILQLNSGPWSQFQRQTDSIDFVFRNMIQINFLSPDLRGTNQYSNNFEVFLYTKCGLNKNIRFCVPDKFEVRLSGQSNLYKDFLGSLFDLFNNYLNRFCPPFRSDSEK